MKAFPALITIAPLSFLAAEGLQGFCLSHSELHLQHEDQRRWKAAKRSHTSDTNHRNLPWRKRLPLGKRSTLADDPIGAAAVTDEADKSIRRLV